MILSFILYISIFNISFNINNFSFKFSNELKKKYGKFELITANNVFAHSPHLYDFCLGVKNILSPKADKIVWSSSVSTLPSNKDKEEFD